VVLRRLKIGLKCTRMTPCQILAAPLEVLVKWITVNIMKLVASQFCRLKLKNLLLFWVESLLALPVFK